MQPNIKLRTNTVHISFDCIGHLVIDDQANVLDIDTTTSQIGSDENVRIAGTQGLQRSFSLLLVFAGVQGGCVPLQGQNAIVSTSIIESDLDEIDENEHPPLRVGGPSQPYRPSSFG